jgi:6-phosphogluconolactonase
MTTVANLQIVADKAALIERAAALTVDAIRTAIAERGQCTLALSGGSTPRPVYERLAAAEIDWQKIQIFWGDERYVPQDHPDSNARMAREAWLDRVSIPPEHIHPVPTAAGDAAIDAARYEATVRSATGCPEGVPTLDVILLGMGDDGHTASLFPGTAVLTETQRLVQAGSKDGEPRITFTFPLINQGRWIYFWVAGASKQAALGQIFAPGAASGGDRVRHYPASGVQPATAEGQLLWLLDRDAAQGLPEHLR